MAIAARQPDRGRCRKADRRGASTFNIEFYDYYGVY